MRSSKPSVTTNNVRNGLLHNRIALMGKSIFLQDADTNGVIHTEIEIHDLNKFMQHIIGNISRRLA